PPKAYACKDHGGGVQHGQRNEQARTLRENGYWIANFLAAVDAKTEIAREDFQDRYNQLLIEKFLIIIDDGWIMRQAQFYRGAFQEEDEREGARKLLTEMAAQAEWIGLRYPALRIGVRLLPHGEDTASVQMVRQVAASLSDQDKGFKTLRGKIHGSPDAGDAKRVRDYVAKNEGLENKAKYLELADEIDSVYQAADLPDLLQENAKYFTGGPWLQKILLDAAMAYESDNSADNHFKVSAQLLADLRDALPRIKSPAARLRVLDLSLAVEGDNFNTSTELRNKTETASRAERTVWLQQALIASYGTGFINRRSLQEAQKAISQLNHDQVLLGIYLKQLANIGRAPGWATQGLRFQFFESMAKLTTIETQALHFIQDQLRGSPLLFLSQTLDSLIRDGNQLAGVKHKLFGKEIGVGFHALNPGLARGTLHTHTDMDDMESIKPDGIYVLPETISDLPPLAGIITAGEGNPLSHVQLLARNLGIPNVTVAESLVPELQPQDGKVVIMAVSPAGLVEMDIDNAHWQKILSKTEQQSDVVIRPDLKKLDLSVREFIPMDQLRASDSGRIVGPKAAKLGELYHSFPEKVSKGIAIPFGEFREVVLDKPYKGGKQTVFEWMVDQYAKIHALPKNSEQQLETAEAFRAELYDIILKTKLNKEFRERLHAAFIKVFGTTELGVFIRSDTNVEDLPGFTGAGLNLTLPNVIGIDGVMDGITRVWASPFTARAFAWRQSHMESPEHVYPAVLLLHSVANDKSGVMVTQDIDTGNMEILSVAVNEGVGGAVDGQSSESIRIDTRDGSVRLLATATAPWRHVPSSKGGVDKLPASGAETVLQPDEIKQLIVFSKELLVKFPPIVDDKGKRAPADVEFGFLDGKLQLFQLRPFLQSDKAQANQYLIEMDKSLQGTMDRKVDMKGVPKS
ncbi:MAG: phosphoenolpyruvate synthase, partial [Gammaproteobacteria bacterium]